MRAPGRLFPTPGLQHAQFAFHCALAASACSRLTGRRSITQGRRITLEMCPIEGPLCCSSPVNNHKASKKKKNTLQMMCLGGNKPGFSIQSGEMTQSLKNINVYSHIMSDVAKPHVASSRSKRRCLVFRNGLSVSVTELIVTTKLKAVTRSALVSHLWHLNKAKPVYNKVFFFFLENNFCFISTSNTCTSVVNILCNPSQHPYLCHGQVLLHCVCSTFDVATC